ncbi:MAG: hypothetical protein JO326_12455 [Acetobacteraceae bacterium]|nr:hypothetical protein [Acetobacteraceae bacterium]
MTYGVWNAGVHENHWFVALIPAFLLADISPNRSAQWLCLAVCVMLNVNLFLFYGITGEEVAGRSVGIDLSVVVSLFYVGLWLAMMGYAWSPGATEPDRAAERTA